VRAPAPGQCAARSQVRINAASRGALWRLRGYPLPPSPHALVAQQSYNGGAKRLCLLGEWQALEATTRKRAPQRRGHVEGTVFW
jgi:hypothetical protein